MNRRLKQKIFFALTVGVFAANSATPQCLLLVWRGAHARRQRPDGIFDGCLTSTLGTMWMDKADADKFA